MTAILHESAPVRYWDHDLGPDQPRLFAVDPDQVQETEIGWAGGDKELRGGGRGGRAVEKIKGTKGPNGRRHPRGSGT